MKRTPHKWSLPDPNEKTYWRSLDQLGKQPEFQEFVDREFPEGASELSSPMSRRSFMHLMGASFALAGLASCRRPEEKILPYSKQPEDVVLGIPKYYATALQAGPEVLGVLVESHEGRPTKIEGNPQHPNSLGATNAFAQAAILDLYDPDRSKDYLRDGKPCSEAEVIELIQACRKTAKEKNGKGFHVLSRDMQSLTLIALRKELQKEFPDMNWHTWSPVNDDLQREASRLVFGQDIHSQLHLDKAQIIVSLGADIFGLEPDAIRNARAFAQNRHPKLTDSQMNRLYVAESSWSITGTSADHRLRVKPSELSLIAGHIALGLGRRGLLPNALWAPLAKAYQNKNLSEKATLFVETLVDDLIAFRTQGVVLIAGQQTPKEVQALVCLLNDALGAPNKTVSYFKTMDAEKTLDRVSVQELAQALQKNQVDTLVILGGNPVYDAPADAALSEHIKKAKHVIYLGLHENETSQLASAHIPQAHALEAWGDLCATDGTVSIVQPLIAPLYKGWSDIELISFWARTQKESGHALVRQQQPSFFVLQATSDATNGREQNLLESAWHAALKNGLVALGLSAHNDSIPSPSPKIELILTGLVKKPFATSTDLEIEFVPDATTYDGQFANNGWLQELPDPITKLTWDNAVLVSTRTAKELGVETNDLLHLTVRGRTLEAAVYVQPGQSDGTLTLSLGYGRTKVGRIGAGAGFNAYALRDSAGLSADGVAAKKTGRTYVDPRDQKDLVDIRAITGFATTQDHFAMEGRELIRETTLEGFVKNKALGGHKHHLPTMYNRPEEFDKGQQWGMSIDLSGCTGCGACTIACQAENNIPIVGKPQVRKGREMHWIRIDRYFSQSSHIDADEPEAIHQPVTCVHCENAPCENVCPVAATMHSPDGMNEMVYNRCIGTRYCSDNCPYKVRRFNFLDWRRENNEHEEVEKLKYNPEVTLRSRGVMEKCTYCVQRVRHAQYDAKKEGKLQIEDGKITPACAQACPTQAIVFGDIRDPNSRVSQLKKDPRNYDLLGELNTRPRTSYLALVRNPNPRLTPAKPQKEEHHG